MKSATRLGSIMLNVGIEPRLNQIHSYLVHVLLLFWTGWQRRLQKMTIVARIRSSSLVFKIMKPVLMATWTITRSVPSWCPTWPQSCPGQNQTRPADAGWVGDTSYIGTFNEQQSYYLPRGNDIFFSAIGREVDEPELSMQGSSKKAWHIKMRRIWC